MSICQKKKKRRTEAHASEPAPNPSFPYFPGPESPWNPPGNPQRNGPTPLTWSAKSSALPRSSFWFCIARAAAAASSSTVLRRVSLPSDGAPEVPLNSLISGSPTLVPGESLALSSTKGSAGVAEVHSRAVLGGRWARAICGAIFPFQLSAFRKGFGWASAASGTWFRLISLWTWQGGLPGWLSGPLNFTLDLGFVRT